jgi:hypothetical protein
MWGSISLFSLPILPGSHLYRAAKLSLGTVVTFSVLNTPPALRLDCTPYSTVREVAALERRSCFVYVRKDEGTEHCANADSCNVIFVSVMIVSVAMCHLRKLVDTT